LKIYGATCAIRNAELLLRLVEDVEAKELIFIEDVEFSSNAVKSGAVGWSSSVLTPAKMNELYIDELVLLVASLATLDIERDQPRENCGQCTYECA